MPIAPTFPGNESGKLVFAESERLDAANAQAGVVSVPIPSGHIYLTTNARGQMRLAMLGRQLRTGEMYGLLTTLFSGSGAASGAGGGAAGRAPR